MEANRHSGLNLTREQEVTMVASNMLMTAGQMADLPEDGFRYELVRGELIRRPLAFRSEGQIGALISLYFGYFIVPGGLGQGYMAGTGFRLSANPDTVLAPTYAFISHARLGQLPKDDGYIPIPPDLCVEVVSATKSSAYVAQKVQDWLDFGTRLVIVIHPQTRETHVHRSPTNIQMLNVHDTLRIDDILPGWSLELAMLF